MTKPMPTIFFGHGNPMNALVTNEYTKAWAAIGREIPRPRAVVAISAHWYQSGVSVTAMPAPPTIHDFGGFPKELSEFNYPAPGDPALAARIQNLLAPLPVGRDMNWGLDHGVWSVLCHVFPAADIPVVQLSIDNRQPPEFHYELGKKLALLRDEGVLVMGSGNIVHNLRAYAWGAEEAEPFDWALRFENRVRELLADADDDSLIAYDGLGRDAMLSVPTPEHYLPLLYVLGLRRTGEPVSFPVKGIEGGSISMLTVQIG